MTLFWFPSTVTVNDRDEYELPIEMKIGLKENSDLCGAAVDPRRHREPVLRQGGYRLGQEDERQQAEMKIEQLSVNLY